MNLILFISHPQISELCHIFKGIGSMVMVCPADDET